MTRPPTASERQRLRSTANMWRALIPLVALVGLLVLLVWPRSGPVRGVHVVDLSGPVAAARQQAGFALVTPTGLPSTWRPTSTDFTAPQPGTPAGFRIGYLTPKGKYAEFYESNDSPDAVTALYGPLDSDAPVQVGSLAWAGFRTSSGNLLISHTFGAATVVVTGSADEAELTELAGSVR